jgi:hypothetical protein
MAAVASEMDEGRCDARRHRAVRHAVQFENRLRFLNMPEYQ